MSSRLTDLLTKCRRDASNGNNLCLCLQLINLIECILSGDRTSTHCKSSALLEALVDCEMDGFIPTTATAITDDVLRLFGESCSSTTPHQDLFSRLHLLCRGVTDGETLLRNRIAQRLGLSTSTSALPTVSAEVLGHLLHELCLRSLSEVELISPRWELPAGVLWFATRVLDALQSFSSPTNHHLDAVVSGVLSAIQHWSSSSESRRAMFAQHHHFKLVVVAKHTIDLLQQLTTSRKLPLSQLLNAHAFALWRDFVADLPQHIRDADIMDATTVRNMKLLFDVLPPPPPPPQPSRFLVADPVFDLEEDEDEELRRVLELSKSVR